MRLPFHFLVWINSSTNSWLQFWGLGNVIFPILLHFSYLSLIDIDLLSPTSYLKPFSNNLPFTIFTNKFGLAMILQSCFASNVELKHCISGKSKPLLPFTCEISFQVFQCIFLSFSSLPYQKLAIILLNSVHNPTGSLMTDIAKEGRVVTTDFRRTSLLAVLSTFLSSILAF